MRQIETGNFDSADFSAPGVDIQPEFLDITPRVETIQTPGIFRKSLIAASGIAATFAIACGGGDKDSGVSAVFVTNTPAAVEGTNTPIVLSTRTSVPTVEATPTVMKTERELAIEKMAPAVKDVHEDIIALSETVLKDQNGKPLTKEDLSRRLLGPLEQAQLVENSNEAVKRNQQFFHYTTTISALAAQYYSNDRNEEIKATAQSLMRYIQTQYPDQYANAESKGFFIPEFKLPAVK